MRFIKKGFSKMHRNLNFSIQSLPACPRLNELHLMQRVKALDFTAASFIEETFAISKLKGTECNL